MVPNCNDFKLHFQSDINELHYGNTVIKKVEHEPNDDSMQPMPLLQFVKSIKDEPDDHGFDDVCNSINIFSKKITFLSMYKLILDVFPGLNYIPYKTENRSILGFKFINMNY